MKVDNLAVQSYIDGIIASKEFWEANYYARSMKKPPHGMIEYTKWPNYFLRHKPVELCVRYAQNPTDIPFFLDAAVEKATDLFYDMEMDAEDIFRHCFNFDQDWYMLFRLLKPKEGDSGSEKAMLLIHQAMCGKVAYSIIYEIDVHYVVYALIIKLIKSKALRIESLSEIERKEALVSGSNKYGLTDITAAEFLRQGFIIDGVYYLYNIFLDGSVAEATDTMPLTMRIFYNETINSYMYMRCDKNLAVLREHIFSTATMDMQLFRGTNLDFDNFENMIHGKEIIVHYNPDTFHKVILIISENKNGGGDTQYQLSVEELWNPESVYDEIITTNFVHGIYSVQCNKFLHVDFSVNQYDIDVYKSKFQDNVSQTGVPIDKYADVHYKVWCVEGEINIDTWGKLVIATLDEPFRDLFAECFTESQIEA